MDPAEREYVERRMFEEDGLALDVFDAEEELMERYRSGTLDADAKARFQRIYGQKGTRKETLRLYQMLSGKQHSANLALPRGWLHPKALIVCLTCIIAALCAVIGILIRQNYGLAEQLRITKDKVSHLSEQSLPKSGITAEIAQNTGSSPGVQIAFLSPSVLRESANSSNSIEIPSTTQFLVLKLQLEKASLAPYQVKLLTVDNNELVYSSGPISSSTENGRPVLSFPLPLSQIQSGDYLIELNSPTTSAHVGPAAEYYFRLRKK
jgi:hypothetical protein